MTTEQIQIIRYSWEPISAKREEAGKLFYQKLFMLAPEVQPLFQANMQEQGNKLMQVLEYIVQHLDDMETLADEIKALGERHKNYGTQPAHYEAVGTCLLATLAEIMGNQWTPEVRNAWTTAFYMIKHTMIVAQNKISTEYSN
jgi:nitric oxide dioxygenase